jgi:hypothetical protein
LPRGDRAGWSAANDGNVCAQPIQRALPICAKKSGWRPEMRT